MPDTRDEGAALLVLKQILQVLKERACGHVESPVQSLYLFT